jgi:hypothetical protein
MRGLAWASAIWLAGIGFLVLLLGDWLDWPWWVGLGFASPFCLLLFLDDGGFESLADSLAGGSRASGEGLDGGGDGG